MEILGPHDWVAISFRAPRLTRRVDVEIDCAHTVHVWALPDDEVSQFSTGGTFEYYTKAKMTAGTLRFTPDRGKDWALILENRHDFEIHVHCDVTW
ncbi:MAG TPA: hypothetical protein VKU41_10050 [Polyangiaceae bacterium]|nr:hypothetical protein [Polyangiaceae bacterium]